MLWGLTPEVLRRNWADGFARVNNWKPAKRTGTVQYLQSGTIAKIRAGEYTITGRAEDGSVEGHVADDVDLGTSPKRVWNMRSHNAETGGTNLITSLLPGRRFDFPKSLYAVEDALRFFVSDKPDAVVLDFFAGSGTTAHAVMRLNKQDGGCRQCISVTNNEVGAVEEKNLRKSGYRPGDPEWEQWGICDYITKPRIEAAISGKTADGEPIKGDYKFTDEFPMTEGFEENVEFFTMTYEAPRPVAHHRSFEAVAPLLWLRAGSEGRRIEKARKDFDVADTYGVLFDLDASRGFLAALSDAEAVRMAFVVTDDEQGYQTVCAELPAHVEPIRLYESYLTNFTINTGRE
jgi:adenine-specific DNA-methyltransferase